VRDNKPRKASAIASHVDSQSPPQWTGNLKAKISHERAHIKDHTPLPTHSGGTRKDNSLSFSKAIPKKIENELVVNDRVGVVNPIRIRAIVEDDIGVGDTLGEIGLCQILCQLFVPGWEWE
jgi:hypothetical protein